MKQTAISQWTMIDADGERFACTVPASMYSILLEKGKIKDPFYRMQEKEATPLSYNDICFETAFAVDAALLSHAHLILRFEGLDTLCDIELNGRRLAYVENMHRTFEFDVKERLVLGENTIKLYFYSPLHAMREAQSRYHLETDLNCFDGAAHFRKAFYMMGWDWGPTLPDMGIWKPVDLLAFDDARLLDVEARQVHRAGKVTLNLSYRAQGATDGLRARYTLTDPDGKLVDTVEGDVDGYASLMVEHPALWWPNGYGDHPLYTLKTELCKDGEVIDTHSMRLGLRTLTVSTAADAWGNEFCFVVNGKKIFSMGANYVPEDNILSRLSRERTQDLLKRCVRANFNTVRVWGGGFYPFDYFYDLCDELGLLVWQDFMFACMNVRMTPSFEANIRAEFDDNIRRIRHHASLGLLCGNNEMEMFVAGGAPYGSSMTAKTDYLYLYERVLPDVCKALVPDTFYWASSPSSGGGFVEPNASNRGDAHYWSVWHSRAPMSDYRRQTFRFCSEFGFESLPNKETVESFSLPVDRNLFSPVMNHHQKCKGANGTIMYYVSEYYLYPESFDATLYASQIMQASAMRYAIEHFRSIRGRCMGATYWQLNDCWPVASWSSVDGGGREKALHHAARRFFAPVLLSVRDEGTHGVFNISNETLEDFCGSVVLTLCDRDLKVLSQETQEVCVPALSAKNVLERDYGAQVAGQENKTYLVYTLKDASGAVVSSSTMLFVRPKFFAFKQPKIETTVTGEGEVKQLHLRADTLVSSLRLDFKDPAIEADVQYFDINTQDEVVVEVSAPGVSASELQRQLSFFSTVDIAPSCIGCNE